jgi:hypothetical protein
MSVRAEAIGDPPITLTRRSFVKMGGALFVSLYLPEQASAIGMFGEAVKIQSERK